MAQEGTETIGLQIEAAKPASVTQPTVRFEDLVEGETRALISTLITAEGRVIPAAVEQLSSALLESFLRENGSVEADSVRIVDKNGRIPRYSVRQLRGAIQAVVRAVLKERHDLDTPRPVAVLKKSKRGEGKPPSSKRPRRAEVWGQIDSTGELEGPSSAATGAALRRLENDLRAE